MSLVIDSSAALAWIFSDEITPAIDSVLKSVIDDGAWVPGLWRLEVANVLELSVRRGRIDSAFRDASLADLALLPISVDLETDRRAWTSTLDLARRHRLTLYDAAYLELALRLTLPLATLETDLRAAAQAESVRVLGV